MKQNIYYTLSGCPSGGSETTYYLGPRGYKYDTGSGLTIRNPKQDFSNYIRIVIKKDVTVNNLLFKPMFNEGQTAQPFEPYTGGKPSPSPEYPQEVRGVDKILATFKGNKSTLTKSLNHTLLKPLYRLSQNVYDYIDFNRGKIIRNVGVVTFDGSDDELWNKYSNNVSMDGYSVNVSNAIDTTPCICNKLLTTDAISTTLEEAIKVLDNAMYVVLNKIRGLNTTELFKSWLQSNPITVCYQLATPTEKDIPQELLTQLKQLQTYSGKTNISFEASDVYPTIDLEYIKDTKKYIESKEELDNQSIIDIDYRVTCLELDMEEQ